MREEAFALAEPLLEEVFKLSGFPKYTFIPPSEYQKLLVSLRTAGRGLVLEGPSGIGKTTSVSQALEELRLRGEALQLTARKDEDRDLISALPSIEDTGVVIIDDFHRLPEDMKRGIADYMKTLADEEAQNSKVVVVGINKAGDSLVRFAADLNNRIDTIRFESNSEERMLELIEKGEAALNISINTRQEIASEAQGSFHLAQMLCHETCLAANITEMCDEQTPVTVSIEVIRETVLEDLRRAFFDITRRIATGPKLRREGRGPYLHVLHWLSRSSEWSIQLDQEMARHPEHRASVGQVVEKGYLDKFLQQNEDFSDVIHYEAETKVLSAEDPKFVYYIRNLIWNKFASQVGYVSMDFQSNYDFALSFAGADRDIAQAIFNRLTDREAAVFYDKNEEHRILAVNIEDYLGPIYRSEAEFVIVLMGKQYPQRIWTKFESDQFKHRFGEHSVIPIWFADAPPGMFDETRQVGGLEFDRNADFDEQLTHIVDTIMKKLEDVRQAAAPDESDPMELAP